jgi:hypothetical protein
MSVAKAATFIQNYDKRPTRSDDPIRLIFTRFAFAGFIEIHALIVEHLAPFENPTFVGHQVAK